MFEPVDGNYVWNLQATLAIACAGNHGELRRLHVDFEMAE